MKKEKKLNRNQENGKRKPKQQVQHKNKVMFLLLFRDIHYDSDDCWHFLIY